nr:class I SAM-dependent methyltransferase [Lysobacter sp. CAU 1642]
MHRYAFAAQLANGRRVLDAASGEGFGSAMLASAGARSVLGVDIDPEAVAHAQRRYADRPALRFESGDATRLESLESASFDLVCSFETLEHVERQEALLEGFARVLTEDGLLLISTPDKRVYSDLAGHDNPFHVRELYRAEFEALLRRHFPAIALWGQKLLFQSVIWSPGRQQGWQANVEGAEQPGMAYEPMYWIALCARSEAALSALPSLHLFGDAAESVYRHYDEEIRKGIRAGHRILELEAEVEQLRARLAASQDAQEKGEGS